MSWTRRLTNLFRQRRLNEEIEEELASHIEEAIEQGRSAEEARKAFGGVLRHREHSRDLKLLPWLDALASDIVFGWRQLRKHRAVSTAAILSLALAIGATTAAFRLVDAVLLRSLPVAEPDRLFFLAITEINHDGRPDYRDDFDYPTFRKHSKTLADRADLMVVGMSAQQDATFGSDDQTERFYRQYVSGNVFGVLGLQSAVGRLLTANDDLTPGAHPIAVLSYDYWNRRFGHDPQAIGKRFRLAGRSYEIVGVAPMGFTGTEPGIVTDIFIPATMNTRALDSPGWSWFRIWVRPKMGVSREQVLQPLQAALSIERQERIKRLDSDVQKPAIDVYANRPLLLPAAAGASGMQKDYRRPLLILAVLVALVLLIACANVGNLLTAQAAARAREMALRVSIGAGRGRLIQLMLVECALLAAIASAAGALFSWWSAPLVVSMLAPADHPVRLVLDADWRVLGFGFALAATVTLLFGLAPALRASAVKPMSALRGGTDPHARRGWMNSLVILQVAFCVTVLFVAGLFVSTFQRLLHRPLGFSPQGVIVLETEARGKNVAAGILTQVADQLRETRGVESVAFAGWAPLTGNRWTGRVRVPGRATETRSPYFLDVSPGYFSTMRVGWIDGRDFRPSDVQPKLLGDNQLVGGVAIVNEAFARAYFDGQDPVGRTIGVHEGKDLFAAMEIVGYVRDACYDSLREPIRPTVYFPIESKGGSAFIIRTANDPRTLLPTLRRVVSARSELRVHGVDTQSALVLRGMLRERLLASISFFFAIVALVLAGVGLYGVLNYSVIQQRREIGIRMTLGARSGQVVRQVTTRILGLVCLGLAIGLTGGVACQRFVETLLFEVKATDPEMMAAPLLTLLSAALLAALPPVVRAVKIDPAQTLRSE